MNSPKVVNLVMVRDMLAELERARQQILAGEVDGFQAVFCDSEQRETIFLCGVYGQQPGMALEASLRLSAARALLSQDEPPQFKTGS